MIHFSHGNGFPAETYHQIVKGLQQCTASPVGYISCIGHNPKYPVENCWSSLVQESIDFIAANYTEPVVAIGHSLGGVLSYWACLQRPELFKAIILIDSPIYSNYKLAFIKLIKALGLLEYFTPARNTINRRYVWPSHKIALEHFASKRAFKYFEQRCLNDYVHFGTEPDDDDIKLRFDPMIEWKIYRSLPSLKISRLANNIPCGLIYGEYSKVVRPNDAMYMQSKHGFWCQQINNCGHLLPFEKPDETVQVILKFFQENNLPVMVN